MNQLQGLKDLGVTHLSVQNHEATAVNPYGGMPDMPITEAIEFHRFRELNLPPLPCPSIENGTYKIGRFSEQWQVQEENEWFNVARGKALSLYTDLPNRMILVLSEPVAESDDNLMTSDDFVKLNNSHEQVAETGQSGQLVMAGNSVEVSEKPEGERICIAFNCKSRATKNYSNSECKIICDDHYKELKDQFNKFYHTPHEAEPVDVYAGYWFSDEHGHDVQVLAVVGDFCMVQDDSKDEPYILPLEFISAIKEASDEVITNHKTIRKDMRVIEWVERLPKEAKEKVHGYLRADESADDILNQPVETLETAVFLCLPDEDDLKEPFSYWYKVIHGANDVSEKPEGETTQLQKAIGLLSNLRHETDCLPDFYYEWMDKVLDFPEFPYESPEAEPVASAEEILNRKIKEYNSTVNDISKFKLNKREVELFSGMLEEYASLRVQQFKSDLTDKLENDLSPETAYVIREFLQ